MTPTKNSPSPPRTRTRAKAEPSPHPVDIDDDSTKLSATPVPSTPSAAIDADVDVPSEYVALADVPPVDIRSMNGPPPDIPPPEVPAAIVPSLDVIDIDNPSHMDIDKEFGRMSISRDSETTYDHHKDDTIDSPTRRAIDAVIQTDKPYTRRTATLLRDDPITLDDEEQPNSITAALRQKYNPSGRSPSTLRRTSSKIVPLDAYLPTSFKVDP